MPFTLQCGGPSKNDTTNAGFRRIWGDGADFGTHFYLFNSSPPASQSCWPCLKRNEKLATKLHWACTVGYPWTLLCLFCSWYYITEALSGVCACHCSQFQNLSQFHELVLSLILFRLTAYSSFAAAILVNFESVCRHFSFRMSLI